MNLKPHYPHKQELFTQPSQLMRRAAIFLFELTIEIASRMKSAGAAYFLQRQRFVVK